MVRHGAFASGVDDFALRFLGGSEEAIRVTFAKLGDAVVIDSPVDSGRFRGSWVATGREPSVKVGPPDSSGKSTINKINAVAFGLKDWSVFTLTSNLPYSAHIEYGLYNDGPKTTKGYSKQAVGGVVRTNIARFNKILETEAKKRLPK